MSDSSSFTFMWVGWCKEDNHDKIWGYIKLNESGAYYNFWGRRGKTLRFKRHFGKWDLEDLTHAKRNKGYVMRTPQNMAAIWPNFEDDFATQFVMAKLAGKILTDPDAT